MCALSRRPKRPQDRVLLDDMANGFDAVLDAQGIGPRVKTKRVPVKGAKHDIGHGDVVIAAITSCTNTSNPSVMLGAGLVARNAIAHGLKVKPWVKTSLAPGSQVVTEYLKKAGLQKSLNALGFNLVGYGCTTCIGNSGPLAPAFQRPSTRTNWWSLPFCRATAILKAESAPMCGQIIWPRPC